MMNCIEITLEGHKIGNVPFHLGPQAQAIMEKYIGQPDTPSVVMQARNEIAALVYADADGGFTHFLSSIFGAPECECEQRESDILPVPERVLYSGDRTIVFWDDGDKTIVKLGDGEQFDEYAGFCAAFTKKMFGSTHKAKKFLKSVKVEQKVKKQKKEGVPVAVEQDPDWEDK